MIAIDGLTTEAMRQPCIAPGDGCANKPSGVVNRLSTEGMAADAWWNLEAACVFSFLAARPSILQEQGAFDGDLAIEHGYCANCV